MKKSRIDSLAVLRRICGAMGGRFDCGIVLQTCVDSLGEALEANRCFIHEKDAQGMYPVSHEFTAGDVASIGIGTTILTPVSYLAHQTLETVRSDDVMSDPRFDESMDKQIYGELGVRSAVAVPIVVSGVDIGQLVVQCCGEPRLWTNDEVELIETVAAQAGVMMQSGRLFAEQETLTASLAGMNQDLSRLYVELAQKDEQIDRFTHLISHDLRAPVVAIRGLVDLLKKAYESEPPDSKPRRYLEIILKSTEQITGLTSALIEYKRLGQSMLSLADVNTEELVREIWQRASLGHDDVALEVFSALPTVRADRSKLARIFQNLFENAIKYKRPEAKAMIDVTCQETDTAWQFAVNDDGIGFPPAEAEQLFDIFTRLREASHRPGSGIGLASVLEIARLHGGTAWATGRPGKGSTFYFSIAREISEEPRPYPPMLGSNGR